MADTVQEHQYAVLTVPDGSIPDEPGKRVLTDPEGKAYAIDWKAWPAAFYVRLPNVRDAPWAQSHGVDFSQGSVEVLKKEDEPGVYYGESNEGAAAYTPLKSTLQLCYFTDTGHIGWLFTWACQFMTHFRCMRVIDVAAGDGLSPVGDYYAFEVDEGALVARPPYRVTAAP